MPHAGGCNQRHSRTHGLFILARSVHAGRPATVQGDTVREAVGVKRHYFLRLWFIIFLVNLSSYSLLYGSDISYSARRHISAFNSGSFNSLARVATSPKRCANICKGVASTDMCLLLFTISLSNPGVFTFHAVFIVWFIIV